MFGILRWITRWSKCNVWNTFLPPPPQFRMEWVKEECTMQCTQYVHIALNASVVSWHSSIHKYTTFQCGDSVTSEKFHRWRLYLLNKKICFWKQFIYFVLELKCTLYLLMVCWREFVTRIVCIFLKPIDDLLKIFSPVEHFIICRMAVDDHYSVYFRVPSGLWGWSRLKHLF